MCVLGQEFNNKLIMDLANPSKEKLIIITVKGEFAGGPVVRTLRFH